MYRLLICISFLFLLHNSVNAQSLAGSDSFEVQNQKLVAGSQILGPGMRTAQRAAIGAVATRPLNYAQILLVGIAIITNNNDNDGQPATFTGGSGSNMAGGG